MSFRVEVLGGDSYARAAAEHIAEGLTGTHSIVLTGGTTAEKIYPFLALQPVDWSGIEVLFSDERCVHPDDPASNYKMANDLLLSDKPTRAVHRMEGERAPEEAAGAYHEAISPVVERGIDLMLLGMGADAHIGAMFPGSPALAETERLCAAVDRPDGMKGLTLTPPAMLAAHKVLLLVVGAGKADTVARVVSGDEPAGLCPARLLADHTDATLLLDEAAAALL